MTASELATDIFEFLATHAGKLPSYDPKWDEASAQYTSPDASMLHAAAEQLERGRAPDLVASSWESGGYKPYQDAKARDRHDQLVEAVNKQGYTLPTVPAAPAS